MLMNVHVNHYGNDHLVCMNVHVKIIIYLHYTAMTLSLACFETSVENELSSLGSNHKNVYGSDTFQSLASKNKITGGGGGDGGGGGCGDGGGGCGPLYYCGCYYADTQVSVLPGLTRPNCLFIQISHTTRKTGLQNMLQLFNLRCMPARSDGHKVKIVCLSFRL